VINEVLAEENATSVNWALVDRATFDSFGDKAYDSNPEYNFRFGFTLDPETNQ
jgi:hypothetical protein